MKAKRKETTQSLTRTISKLDESASIIQTLMEYLVESHEGELGDDHFGDGGSGCTYCQAIETAREFLESVGNEW